MQARPAAADPGWFLLPGSRPSTGGQIQTRPTAPDDPAPGDYLLHRITQPGPQRVIATGRRAADKQAELQVGGTGGGFLLCFVSRFCSPARLGP